MAETLSHNIILDRGDQHEERNRTVVRDKQTESDRITCRMDLRWLHLFNKLQATDWHEHIQVREVIDIWQNVPSVLPHSVLLNSAVSLVA